MAIEKKLIHFGKLVDFEAQLTAGNILDYSIVFIQDAKKIWTHGTYYDCSEAEDVSSISWENIESKPAEISFLSGLESNIQEQLDDKAEDSGVVHNTGTETINGVKTFNNRVNFVGSGDANAVYLTTNTRIDVYGTTQTVLGFASGTFLINHGSYNLTLRGKGTRPLYNSTEIALSSDIPTKTSALTNDSGFLTEHQDISGKQDVISDIELIRDGAARGATALQSVPSEYITETELNNKGYLTEHQDISGKQDKLISGTTIKTIDGESVLGSGNISLPELNAQYDETNQRLILQDVRDNTSLIEDSKKAALRELYIAAGALYNDTGTDITKTAPWGEEVIHKAGYYYLNGLGDITDNEMLVIYEAGEYWLAENAAGVLSGSKGRTNITPTTFMHYAYKTFNFTQAVNNSMISVLVLADAKDIKVSAMRFFGQDSNSLSRIVGVIDLTATSTQAFNPKALEYINIKNLKCNLDIHWSPKISKESVLFMIENAAPTSKITITLHADAYARLATDADIVAALEAQPLITLVSA